MKSKVPFYVFIIILLSITALAKNNEDMGMLGKYVIKKARPYGIELADKECKNITKKELLDVKSIEDLLDSFPKNEFTITDYHLTIAAYKRDLIEIKGRGNQFTERMKEEIKKLQPGAILYFEYIKGKNDRGVLKSFAARCFVIVDK